MRIVILGSGNLGSRLATRYSDAGHEIVVMDRDQEPLQQLGPHFRGETLSGSAFIEANIQRIFEAKADVFVAVTDKDNVNIMWAQLVKTKFNVPRVIARVYDPILAGIFRELDIETVCPTMLALEAIEGRLLKKEG
ncbi:MAG TPA: NAD-binding protein [Thermodesulfobacteriota bacterium]|nr:NAD-binding protein [Thermodesulfobacteriota bacterium]